MWINNQLSLDDIKLKPCPFCGKQFNDYPEVMIIEKRKIMPDLYCVRCPKCSAFGSSEWSKKEAIEKWNKRFEGRDE